MSMCERDFLAIPNNSNTHTSFGAWSPSRARKTCRQGCLLFFHVSYVPPQRTLISLENFTTERSRQQAVGALAHAFPPSVIIRGPAQLGSATIKATRKILFELSFGHFFRSGKHGEPPSPSEFAPTEASAFYFAGAPYCIRESETHHLENVGGPSPGPRERCISALAHTRA